MGGARGNTPHPWHTLMLRLLWIGSLGDRAVSLIIDHWILGVCNLQPREIHILHHPLHSPIKLRPIKRSNLNVLNCRTSYEAVSQIRNIQISPRTCRPRSWRCTGHLPALPRFDPDQLLHVRTHDCGHHLRNLTRGVPSSGISKLIIGCLSTADRLPYLCPQCALVITRPPIGVTSIVPTFAEGLSPSPTPSLSPFTVDCLYNINPLSRLSRLSERNLCLPELLCSI